MQPLAVWKMKRKASKVIMKIPGWSIPQSTDTEIFPDEVAAGHATGAVFQDFQRRAFSNVTEGGELAAYRGWPIRDRESGEALGVGV